MTVFTEKPTLFVVARRNDLLEVHGESLRIRDSKSGEIRKKIPALGIRDVVICGDLEVKCKIFSIAEKYKLPIHFLSTGGKFKASTIFDFSKNVFVRYKQFLIFENKEKRLNLAKKFIEAKVKNQNTFLQKIRAKGRIKIDLADVNDLSVLRGKEGAIAQSYFSLWKKDSIIKTVDFRFSKRIKRPATDPMNAILSFCYALLHGEIHTQLLIAGLDPCIAFLHDQGFGHPALASDFTEVYRGLADHFVIKSVNRKEFNPDTDFVTDNGGEVRLSSEGFKKFFPKWSSFLRTEKTNGDKNLTQIIEKDVRKLIHFLMEDEKDFQPFIWKK